MIFLKNNTWKNKNSVWLFFLLKPNRTENDYPYEDRKFLKIKNS